MANKAILNAVFDLLEDQGGNELAVGQIRHASSIAQRTLNAGSTPAVTKVYAQELQLSTGALTVDLTSLVDGNGAALDLTGLKVQAILIINAPKTGTPNTDTLNVVVGATNGYNWAGDSASEITLPIGGWALLYLPEGTPDVAAGAKEIDFSGSDADAEFQLLIAAG